jgi:predicted nucleotidyltransferase
MDRTSLIAELMQLRPQLEARGVRHLSIYGSRARGDASHKSDIDLLIEVASDSHFSLLDLIGVEQLVSDQIGIDAHGAMRRSIPERFAKRIANDLIEVF